jgi:2,3-diketo-5-methylthio-1-phosphopentane phosphatase
MRPHFAVDFDGTVSLTDTTDHLLDRFAGPEWQEVEQDWVAGRIGSRECLARQIAMICASECEIEDAVLAIAIDPAFPAFAALAAEHGATLEIISDGFDRFIMPILEREELKLPLTCNRLVPAGGRRWRAEFPYASNHCTTMSGVCKCRTLDAERFVVLIGDGRSDFCLAGQADFVLAKGKLASHCRDQNYAHQAISDFADATNWLKLHATTSGGAFSSTK